MDPRHSPIKVLLVVVVGKHSFEEAFSLSFQYIGSSIFNYVLLGESPFSRINIYGKWWWW